MKNSSVREAIDAGVHDLLEALDRHPEALHQLIVQQLEHEQNIRTAVAKIESSETRAAVALRRWKDKAHQGDGAVVVVPGPVVHEPVL